MFIAASVHGRKEMRKMELVEKLPNMNTIYNLILTDCLPFDYSLPVTLLAKHEMKLSTLSYSNEKE